MPRTERPKTVIRFDEAGHITWLPYHLTDGEQQRELVLWVFMAAVVAAVWGLVSWLTGG